MSILVDHIEPYKFLFRGWEDIYAIRWEKDSKSGYMPACKINWRDSIQQLYLVCTKYEIPSYIERSRSGNGGHLRIFFKENLLAEQMRKLLYELLREASIIFHL